MFPAIAMCMVLFLGYEIYYFIFGKNIS